MKTIYYRGLLNQNYNMTQVEKILYSFLVSKSLSRHDYSFDDGRRLNIGMIEESEKEYGGYIFLCDVNKKKIAKTLGITRRSVITLFGDLMLKGYLKDESGYMMIYGCVNLAKSGYFELKNPFGLRGEAMVFYSYLADRSKSRNNALNFSIEKIAYEFGTTDATIKKLLRKLSDVGAVFRDERKVLHIVTKD